jgi:hypothetical protein
MLSHELLENEGILIVRPQGALQAADFEALAREVDPYIERAGALHGLMVEAESFPGWDSFGALVSHLRFVRDHQRFIQKIAVVSDSAILNIAPRIVSHFVQAQVRHFDYADRSEALEWLKQD